MRLITVLTIFTATLCLAQTPPPQKAVPQTDAKAFGDAEYRLGPEDVIHVFVYKEAELSTEVVVRPDGKVSLPLIGELVASGMTTQQLQSELKQKLAQYVADPIVNVIVKEVNSAKVSVLGEVKNPGTFALEKEGTTILEAVTIAGGFTQKAAPVGTKVIRKLPDGRQDTIPVDLSGPIPAKRDFKIQDGDSILVPRGNTFFVFGEVKKPGDYQLERDTTILEAISIAGGFTDKAAPGRTKIIRTTEKGQQTIDVDMNEIIKRGRREKSVPLIENDVVVVPEAYF